MLERFVNDFKDSTGLAIRLTSLALAAAILLFITTCFLCAAAFVAVLQKYGLIQACLAGAAVFFLAALMAAILYAVRKRQIKKRPVEAAKSVMQTALADPMIVAAGLQIVRTIGLKRMIPLLAIGGIALGVMANRRHGDDEAETDDE
jgi:hypothetical protein